MKVVFKKDFEVIERELEDIDDLSEFLQNENIVEIEMPEGVEKVGENAFYRCENLKKITLPSSVKVLEKYAFAYCKNLEEIEIPEGVEKIGEGAFSSCKNLKKVTLPSSVNELEILAFGYCGKIEEIVIPEGVDKISYRTFYNCESLKKITLPSSIKVLEKDAFVHCDNIVEIEIPEGVEKIGEGAFYGCENLKKITLPSSLKEIDEGAFFKCEKIEEIVIPEGVEKIGKGAFSRCENLKRVSLPDSILSIDLDAFWYCKNLENIKIPEGKRSTTYTVRFEDNIQTITLPAIAKMLEKRAFSDCDNIVEIEIPEGVEKIGESAFYRCKNLKKVTLPSSLKVIEKESFLDCEKIEEIIIPEGVEEIGESAFYGCENLKKVTLPSSLKTIDKGAFFKCEKIEEIVIPEGVKEIDIEAFCDCKNLKKVTLPSSLKTINEGAFWDCENLEEIMIPEGVEVIRKNAFCNCKSLKKVTLSEGSLRVICEEVFYNCENLEEIIIPEGVMIVRENAFCNCKSLKKVSLPNTLYTIPSDTFRECRNLEEITVPFGLNMSESYYFLHNIKSFKIVDDGRVMLNNKNEESENSCSVFENFPGIDVNVILSNKDKIHEIIEKVNGMPRGIVVPKYSINDMTTFEKFLNIDYKIMKNLINLIPEEKREICMRELYKIAMAMGILENKEVTIKVNGKEVPVRDVAYTVLQGAIKQNILDVDKIHANFSSMKLGDYNEEFLKFMENKTTLSELMNQEESQPGFTARVHSWFEDRKHMTLGSNSEDFTDPTSEENRYKIMTYEGTENGVDRVKWKKPTVELLKKEFAAKKFTGITTKRDKVIGEYLSQYHLYEQKHFDKAKEIDRERIEKGVADRLTKEKVETTIVESIDDYRRRTIALNEEILDEAQDVLKTQKDIADKIFTYEMLAKSDVANFAMGLLTSCCATLYGAGAGAQRAMIIDKDMQPLVIKDYKGNIIAFGIVYVNREEGYAVINDFELNKKYESKEVRKEIYTKAMQGVEHFVRQYNKENPDKPINIVTSGTSPNWSALNDFIRENPKSSILKAPNFDDFKYAGSGSWSGDWHKEQYVVWENKDKGINKR